jgi:hypothetical protein
VHSVRKSNARGGLALSGMRFASHLSHGTIIEKQRALSITQTKLR